VLKSLGTKPRSWDRSSGATGASGIQGNWCIYSIHAIYSCLVILENHNSGGGPSIYIPLVYIGWGSYERGLKYAHILAGTSSQLALVGKVLWIPGHNNVLGLTLILPQWWLITQY